MQLTRQGREVFLAERQGVFSLHRRYLPAVAGCGATRGEFKRVHRSREQCFALQKSQKVAIQAGMDLQGVPAVLDHIGIHKARDDAFAEESLAQLLGQRCG